METYCKVVAYSFKNYLFSEGGLITHFIVTNIHLLLYFCIFDTFYLYLLQVKNTQIAQYPLIAYGLNILMETSIYMH